MKCPRCPGRMELGKQCPECGWKPTDLLEEALANIERILEGDVPGITDPTGAAKSVAYQGSGIGYAFVNLGLMSGHEWMEWSKRLYDAAGIGYEPVSGSISFSMDATASGPTAAALFAGEHLRKPNSLRGVYVDRRPEQQVKVRFTFAAPDCYGG